MNEENKIILYQDDNETTRVSVRFADEDLWLTQNQLAEIYDTSQQNISQHIDNIYKDGELIAEATNKKFLLVRREGNRQVKRNIDHYNLDMVIALGYRVQSQIATRFRRWATQRLHEYIQKGFAMDDERLKQGGNHKRPVISILINCGFLEYEQNSVAVSMIRYFCRRYNFPIGSTLMLGSGEAILGTPFRYVAVRAIKRLSESVNKGNYKDITATMPLPKWLFKMAARSYWISYGKKFGVSEKEMQRLEIEI